MTMDYNPDTKAVSVHIELENGIIWLIKSQITELFGVYISAVTMNRRSIFKEVEAFIAANRSEINYQNSKWRILPPHALQFGYNYLTCV